MNNLSIEELERRVLLISEEMKGPLHNTERALLHQDRKDLRAMIAQKKAGK